MIVLVELLSEFVCIIGNDSRRESSSSFSYLLWITVEYLDEPNLLGAELDTLQNSPFRSRQPYGVCCVYVRGYTG